MDEEQTESESPQAQLAPLGPGIAKISHAPIFSVRYGDDGQPLAIHCSNVLPEGYTEVDEAAYREAEAGLARALPEMPPPPPDLQALLNEALRRIEALEQKEAPG